MVKVKLVEKRVNRKVGIVIVLNVMSQYRMPGTTLTSKIITCPNIPSQES